MSADCTDTGGPKVEVDVFDHDGRRLDNAVVTLTRTTDGQVHRLELDPSGLFYQAGKVAPGSYQLAARTCGLAEDRRAIEIGAGGLRTVVMLGHAGMPFYYRGDVRVPFRRRDDLVAVAVDLNSADESNRNIDAVASAAGLLDEALDRSVKSQGVRLLRFAPGTPPSARIATTAQFAAIAAAVGPPVWWLGGSAGLAFLTDQYVVKFRPEAGTSEIAAAVQQFGLEKMRQLAQAPNTWLFRVRRPGRFEALEVAQQLVDTGLVAYAEPNLVSVASQSDGTPMSGLLFPMQWHLPLIGCPQAWHSLDDRVGSAMGSPDITIAVVDWGLDVDNPAFAGKVSDGNSKIASVFDFQQMVAAAKPQDHGHGTNCAGVATGKAGGGAVCGVAGNCRLIAVRRPEGAAGTDAAYADMYFWIAGFDAGVTGFPPRLDAGADVISNSFGHGTGAPISGLMRDTFHHLTTCGRGGRGTLLLFSAGNHDPAQDFTLARPWASSGLAVAVTASSLASDGIGEIHTPQSNYGGGAARIDVCAPSASWLGAPYDPPHSYAIVTAASQSGDPDFNHNPNAPSRTDTCTVTVEPSTAKATVLAVASTGGFKRDQFIIVGTLGEDDAEFSQVTDIGIGRLEVTALLKAHPSRTQVIGGCSWASRGFSGTSAATAMVAGVAALILSANPDLTWTEVRDILRETAVPIDVDNQNPNGIWRNAAGAPSGTSGCTKPCYSRWYGFGRIDAAAAVEHALMRRRSSVPASTPPSI